MQLYIVLKGGGPLPVGTIVRKFDQGFCEITKDENGKITGTKELIIPHLSLHPFLLPYNLYGQWDLYNGEAYHRGATDGSADHAIQDAVFNQPVVGDEFEDPEEFM
jgi:hypothetical protein